MRSTENASSLKFLKSATRKLFALVLLFSCAGAETAQAKSPAQPLQFTILHTNDLHSHDLEFKENGQKIGGMPRIISLMRKLRAENHNKTITIDSGDIFEGTPFFTYYHGAVEVGLLNDARYDIYTIGNHELTMVLQIWRNS